MSRLMKKINNNNAVTLYIFFFPFVLTSVMEDQLNIIMSCKFCNARIHFRCKTRTVHFE